MTGPQDEAFPFDDEPTHGSWLSPPEMTTGRWVEIPVDDDGPQRWMRIEVLVPPQWTFDHRWALRLRRDGEDYWIKVAPWLRFPTLDHDPTEHDPDGSGTDGSPTGGVAA